MTSIHITDEAVDKALSYLRNSHSAGNRASARATRLWSEKQIKVVWAQEFLKAEAKTVTEREAIAEASAAYSDMLHIYREAVQADEMNREMVNTCNSILDLYRTQEASKRSGL